VDQQKNGDGIRRARPEEGPFLTELTLRSKAYWGYDEDFMRGARIDLAFDADKFLPDFHVYVMVERGRRVGFCSLLRMDRGTVELHDLFVEPDAIGKGYGRRLFEHATQTAEGLGYETMVLTADPNAEPFYRSRGAIRIGQTESNIQKGRMLPVMRYQLSPRVPR
jgi:GNAT superfamily N-acetyltransferase